MAGLGGLSGPVGVLLFKFCCSVYTLCHFGMGVSFQTCLCVCVKSFRRAEGGGCFLLNEFEAENSQWVGMRAEVEVSLNCFKVPS